MEIAIPLLGTCPHFPQSVLLFFEALFMQPEEQGLKEKLGEEEQVQRSGKM